MLSWRFFKNTFDEADILVKKEADRTEEKRAIIKVQKFSPRKNNLGLLRYEEYRNSVRLTAKCMCKQDRKMGPFNLYFHFTTLIFS